MPNKHLYIFQTKLSKGLKAVSRRNKRIKINKDKNKNKTYKNTKINKYKNKYKNTR